MRVAVVAMQRIICSVFLILPRFIMGLLLLAPEDFHSKSRNDTFLVDLEDSRLIQSILHTDSQSIVLPVSNLERTHFPLEWYDITLDGDTVSRGRKGSRHHVRHQKEPENHKLFAEGDDASDGSLDVRTKSGSDRMSKSNKSRVKRSSFSVHVPGHEKTNSLKHIFMIPRMMLRNRRVGSGEKQPINRMREHIDFRNFISFNPSLSSSLFSQSSEETAISSLTETQGVSLRNDVNSSMENTSKSSIVHTSESFLKSSLENASGSSFVNTSRPFFGDISGSSFKDNSRPQHINNSRSLSSRTQGSSNMMMIIERQNQLPTSAKISNFFLFNSDRLSRPAVSDSTKLRHKRWAPSVKRVKMYEMVTANSGISQPVIVRKRNRVDAKVGVLVVVENSIYRQYLMDNSNNPRAALARIRRYYGMIFSMIDQRFQTINDPYLSVSVSISGILVAERREDSDWLEQIVDWSTITSHGRGSVLTDKALKKFTKWISGRGGLPEFDHAMVFTAYRLTNKQSVSLGGMAYLNAICDTKSGNSVSIVADTGDFQCVKVATHELAHSLGAYHDGDRQSKSCRPDSNFVMSPLTSHQSRVLRNAFFFSPCSIRDMSHHLIKPTSSCVRNEPPVYYSFDLKRLPPGQLYNADMQCKLVFGKKSELCREGDLVNIMCGQLWCRDPNKERGCRTNTYLTALPGTECGPNRVCHLGECIIDTSKNVIQRTPVSVKPAAKPSQSKQTPLRSQGAKKQEPRRMRLKTRTNKRSRRKRKNRCTEDKNPNYCEGLIKLNPRGCVRQEIRQYCCVTCRRTLQQQARGT